MFIDVEQGDRSWQDVYRLAITFVIPRPIGWVSTISREGIRNLAPFSFYNMVCAHPPIVMFCPGRRRDGSFKDSLNNVLATKEFVVAAATERLAEAMNQTSADYPPEVEEFGAAGLTPKPARFVRSALVGESPVNIECRLHDTVSFGDHAGSGHVVFGRLLAIHVDDAVLAGDGLVDPLKLQALGRLGRADYVRTRDLFDLPRPKVD